MYVYTYMHTYMTDISLSILCAGVPTNMVIFRPTVESNITTEQLCERLAERGVLLYPYVADTFRWHVSVATLMLIGSRANSKRPPSSCVCPYLNDSARRHV